jgi:hypothetical protein
MYEKVHFTSEFLLHLCYPVHFYLMFLIWFNLEDTLQCYTFAEYSLK